MIDKTYEILLRKFQPDSPLLQVQDPEPMEVRKASITLKELMLQVRDEMLTSWGLDPKGRHLFADDIVALATIEKCSEYNVTDMPKGGTE
jgi:hypothetical protein